MLNLFKKDQLTKLKDQYTSKVAEAVKSQENGDVKKHSVLSWEAEDLLKEIQALEAIQ